MSSTATLKMLLLGEDRSAGRALKGVGNEAQRSEGRLRGFGKVAAGVFTGGLALQGARSLGRFLKEAGQSAIEDEKSTALLARQMHNSAGATKAQVAATEDWITAQGKAYGVTDNDLRPALSRLVAVTHSVTKARKLASLGENISAGTGKSLTVVTAALAKAQTGSMTGLSKLGAVTKDAKGKALSLHAVTKQLAETYRGQAARSASTAAGQWARLNVMYDETKEAIGYRLLPLTTALAQFILGTLVPSVSKAAKTLQSDLGPAFERIRSAISSAQPFFQRVAQFMKDNPDTVKVFAYTLGALAIALGVVSVAVWAVNVALAANPIGIVVIALAALAAGLYYAYTHSTGFRKAVNAMGAALKWLGGAVLDVVRFIKNHWVLVGTILLGPIFFAAVQIAKHWGKISGLISSGVSWVIRFVRGNWQAILATLLAGPFGLAVVMIVKHWGAITGAVRSGVSRVISWVNSLPGKILGAVGDFGTLLYNSGRELISGLISGITSKIGDVGHAMSGIASKVKGFLPGSPVKEGPLRSWNNGGAGIRLMKLLVDGIAKGEVPLSKVLDRVTAHIAKTGDRLKGLLSARADFASGFGRLSDGIFGADYTAATTVKSIDPTTGEETESQRPLSILDQIAAATSQRDTSKQVRGDVNKLIGLGLSGSLIKQMQAQGDVAGIHALASGTRAQIAQLNSLNAQAAGNYQAAGVNAYGAIGSNAADLRDAERDDKLARALKQAVADAVREAGHAGKHEVTELTLHGDKLVAVIRRSQKDRSVPEKDRLP